MKTDETIFGMCFKVIQDKERERKMYIQNRTSNVMTAGNVSMEGYHILFFSPADV